MFSSNNKLEPSTDTPDPSGRVHMVTGGSTGIGYGIMAHILQCNHARLDLLDVLILNGRARRWAVRGDEGGLGSHTQVTGIVQHHLSRTLLLLLIATPDSRLCLQSSEVSPTSAQINKNIRPVMLYAPWANATHPGSVVTGQQDQAVEANGTLGCIGVKAVGPFMKNLVDEGCRPVLFAATGDMVATEKIDGEYIISDRKVTDPSNQGLGEELGESVFDLLRRGALIGIDFIHLLSFCAETGCTEILWLSGAPTVAG
ncbi:hypothetical protein GGR58DRAFT_513677 [Xylaria digitata]|nr:hypothetical protein GGR58DRAFT_513677 [Xylaria digitata]